MARQQAARRPIERNRTNGSPQQQASTAIRFQPELAVQAIVFHLVDEGITGHVAEDSVRATVSRLQRAAVAPNVEQWMWAEMTHAQRLEWLLEHTQTAARLLSEELAVLEPAKA